MKLPTALLLVAVAAGCGGSPGLNVLVVSFDTTRADHLRCYGHQAIETPSIDSVATEGTL